MSLKLLNLTKTFENKEAVKNLNIEMKEKRTLGIIGQNGSGKTTTFRMILGLLKPTYGEIIWKGKAITHINPDAIGYLPEERGLYSDMTIEDQLLFFAELKGKKRKEISPQIDGWLERLAVKGKKKDKIKTLSKGNQQKIQLISTIIHKPEIVILDEPFSGLDPVNAELLKDTIFELKKKGTTLIFSSHRMDHVEELCDDICLLQNGTSLLKGDINEIKSKFGKKKIILRSHHQEHEINNLPGVESVNKVSDKLIIYLKDQSYRESVFEYVVKDGFVETFSAETPNLEEIFKAKVGEKNE
ncbi:ABC transporter, ATP-binding protein (plasmid) [Priestia megaterium]|uniref:ABC transporter ATP-binding protein n=1 Tax=Priestia megaterium TaxID=1404 RepID=UPI0015DCF4CD|nr:ATP-binding cassette domain-containing protein [Priestia megaterium]QLK09300.1 ABC transporter, ATP-binding protein [Priestia megaterium]